MVDATPTGLRSAYEPRKRVHFDQIGARKPNARRNGVSASPCFSTSWSGHRVVSASWGDPWEATPDIRFCKTDTPLQLFSVDRYLEQPSWGNFVLHRQIPCSWPEASSLLPVIRVNTLPSDRVQLVETEQVVAAADGRPTAGADSAILSEHPEIHVQKSCMRVSA